MSSLFLPGCKPSTELACHTPHGVSIWCGGWCGRCRWFWSIWLSWTFPGLVVINGLSKEMVPGSLRFFLEGMHDLFFCCGLGVKSCLRINTASSLHLSLATARSQGISYCGIMLLIASRLTPPSRNHRSPFLLKKTSKNLAARVYYHPL